MSGSQQSIGRDARLDVSPDVISQRTGEQMVVVHLGSNRVYDLSVTATRLWELVTGGRSRSEAEADLLAEFDVDPAALTAEIDATLAHLTGEDLLRVRPGD